MKKLYQKNEITFALVWIGIYLAVMNTALQFCGGFDHLETKTVPQLLIPVLCIIALCVLATVWIVRNGLSEYYGLCKFKGNAKAFLWFIPLVLMSCINLKNGLSLSARLSLSVLMAVNMAAAGYMEEILFRGFLFRGMAKDNLKTAIIVSAVTFGAGHIVNLANTKDILGVFLQISYAIVIGFLYTLVVWKGGSLLPCILSHMFVNASSVFAPEEGPFSQLIALLFGQATDQLVQICSAVLIIILSGGYALWLLRKAR